MLTQRIFLIAAILFIAQPARCRVFVRWTEAAIPREQALGVSDLVIPWAANAASLIRTARRRGYRVYAEAGPASAAAAADSSRQSGLTGIIVKAPGDGPIASAPGSANERARLDSLLSRLRKSYPALSVRLLWSGSKQPQMRGTMVVTRNGALQVSSPTEQPWIDSNAALIRFERADDPAETPLIEFAWNLTDSLEQEYGPPPEDYDLAVAEAGAFRADLILPLYQRLQAGLAQGKPEAWKTWREIQRYIRFYAAPSRNAGTVLMSNVAVVTNDYDASYEAVNLMARHNIPFRVIRPDDLETSDFGGTALWVIFGPLGRAATQALERQVASGRTAMWVGKNFPWHSAKISRRTPDTAVYDVGKGTAVEIAAPVADPEPFARDVWRLLPEPEREMTLWNSLTILAASYQASHAASADLDLVNYALQNMRAQARIKGSFSQIRYETPEDGCCVSLAATRQNSFTEFVVPKLRIGGRVHLAAPQNDAK